MENLKELDYAELVQIEGGKICWEVVGKVMGAVAAVAVVVGALFGLGAINND